MQTDNGFSFRAADPSETKAHQAFRFQVFGEECGYLDETDCPDRLDVDGFDPYSSQVIALLNGTIVGCCRLTRNNPVGGSYTERFFHLPPPPVDRDRIAEINRFAIAKDHRRGAESKTIRFGMFRILYEEAVKMGIEHTYLTMHRPFFTLLKRDGIPFVMIEGYRIREYNGYYSRYFDPADTCPSILHRDAFAAFMYYKGFGDGVES